MLQRVIMNTKPYEKKKKKGLHHTWFSLLASLPRPKMQVRFLVLAAAFQRGQNEKILTHTDICAIGWNLKIFNLLFSYTETMS